MLDYWLCNHYNDIERMNLGMERYVNLVREFIEKPRNELREKVCKNPDKKLKELLDKYEDAYYKRCLKIEEYIDLELEKMDLNHKC